MDGSPVTYAIHSRPHFVADVRGLRRAKVGAVVLFHTTLKTGPFVFLLICKDHSILLVLSHKFLYNKLIKQRRDEGERAMDSIDLIIGMRVGSTLGYPIEEIWPGDVIWFESGERETPTGVATNQGHDALIWYTSSRTCK